MDRFKEVEALVLAAEAGSLAAAARRVGITPAMLGRRIDALEARLGVTLLQRSTRRLALTERGAAYVEQCRRLLAEFEAAEQEASQARHRATGHLVVSAPAAFGRRHVAPHAPAFLKRHPDLRISFHLTDRVVDIVREGYDVGVRIGGAIEPNFVAVKLAANRRVVCGTPAYFRKHGRPRTLEDLATHDCLAFNLAGGQQRGWYFQRDGRTVTVPVKGPLDCNDGELLHRWVSEGLGLGWRSSWEIEAQLARGELVTVLDEFELPAYDIMALYPGQRFVPAKVRLFVEHLKRAYAQPGYWTAG